ncbi:MAG: CorA family divalent cation transporter [Candidatus Aenigmatarchaeota archaeon]
MIKFLYRASPKRYGQGSGLKYPRPRKGFVWIHVTSPTKAEIKRLSKDFGMKETLFEKYRKERRSMKYSWSPLSFVIVDYYPIRGGTGVENVLFFARENVLVTVTEKMLPHYNSIFKKVNLMLPKLKGLGYLLYEIMDYDMEENFEVLHLNERRIAKLEEQMIGRSKQKDIIRDIVSLKRSLLVMWRRFWGTSKIIFSIRKGLTSVKIDPSLARMLDDIHDAYIYQMEMVSAQRETLTDAITINETVISNRLASISNRINLSVRKLTWIMFILTGIGTVIAVPNTLGTFYGIPYLPLQEQFNLITWTLAITVIVPVILFLIYWKKVRPEAG